MVTWFYSYWTAPKDARIIRGGYWATSPSRYLTEAMCVAAATAYRLQTGNTKIRIHRRGRGGKSSSYRLDEKDK